MEKCWGGRCRCLNVCVIVHLREWFVKIYSNVIGEIKDEKVTVTEILS
jgi:hypothetical protein